MTDRFKGFVVHLDDDMRDDDAECVLNAILMIKHVAKAEPIMADYEDELNRERVRRELRTKLFEALK